MRTLAIGSHINQGLEAKFVETHLGAYGFGITVLMAAFAQRAAVPDYYSLHHSHVASIIARAREHFEEKRSN